MQKKKKQKLFCEILEKLYTCKLIHDGSHNLPSSCGFKTVRADWEATRSERCLTSRRHPESIPSAGKSSAGHILASLDRGRGLIGFC